MVAFNSILFRLVLIILRFFVRLFYRSITAFGRLRFYFLASICLRDDMVLIGRRVVVGISGDQRIYIVSRENIGIFHVIISNFLFHFDDVITRFSCQRSLLHRRKLGGVLKSIQKLASAVMINIYSSGCLSSKLV